MVLQYISTYHVMPLLVSQTKLQIELDQSDDWGRETFTNNVRDNINEQVNKIRKERAKGRRTIKITGVVIFLVTAVLELFFATLQDTWKERKTRYCIFDTAENLFVALLMGWVLIKMYG